MRKLLIISMLILGIAVHAFCQKKKVGYDTLSVLDGVRPPILINGFSRKSDIYFKEEVKKNANHLIIDFGNKNRLLIDYQGDTKYELKQNVDSLLQNFWKDYSLISDTVNKNMVKKITYFGKNKNVNRKAIIDIQYFPQKEVFQFGKEKEVELVRLKQDTLVLINFDNEATSKLVKSYNRVFKTYEDHVFLFNLNSLDDIEDILETNINRSIVETAERIESERKIIKPWKMIEVENDVMGQRIRSKVRGNALFDIINFHADMGIGVIKEQAQGSATFAFDIASSSYLKKGFALGVQSSFRIAERTNSSLLSILTPTYFTGMTFYQRKNNTNQFKGGVFVGYSRFRDPKSNAPSADAKIFGWYQLSPLIRIQPEIGLFTYDVIDRKIKSASGSLGLRLSFGF
ncbi:hypothetical protein [Emticicia sp. SJ17W-69]|uniref:hypothetical protein n=1 Tax=Emticicia sp. SJ17W-69 TaxID=3421657 RepID=UPI003EBA66C0